MVIRFRIRAILILTAIAAVVLGFFAPELRAWDRTTRVLFSVVGVMTAVVLISFTPVWVVLFALRRRSRRGFAYRGVDILFLAAAYLLSLVNLVALAYFGTRMMAAR